MGPEYGKPGWAQTPPVPPAQRRRGSARPLAWQMRPYSRRLSLNARGLATEKWTCRAFRAPRPDRGETMVASQDTSPDGAVPTLLAADLQDHLMTASNDLDRLQRLLADA